MCFFLLFQLPFHRFGQFIFENHLIGEIRLRSQFSLYGKICLAMKSHCISLIFDWLIFICRGFFNIYNMLHLYSGVAEGRPNKVHGVPCNTWLYVANKFSTSLAGNNVCRSWRWWWCRCWWQSCWYGRSSSHVAQNLCCYILVIVSLYFVGRNICGEMRTISVVVAFELSLKFVSMHWAFVDMKPTGICLSACDLILVLLWCQHIPTANFDSVFISHRCCCFCC